MSRKIISILLLNLLLLAVPQTITAQIPVGAFRSHLSYYGIHSVVAAPDFVYAAADNGVLFYDRSDASVDTWSKVEGLSDTEISTLFYDEESGYLIVVYDNANLDFIREGRLQNLPDIKEKTMTGSKRINEVLSYDGLLYLSCTFGIVIVDPSTLLIKDTWYTQLESSTCVVNSLQIFDEQCFALTDEGVFFAPLASHSLADFSTWQRVDAVPAGQYLESCVFNGRLYVSRHYNDQTDSLYVYDGTSWQISSIALSPVRALDASDEMLLAATWSHAITYDTAENQVEIYYYDAPYQWQNVQDVCLDGNFVWIADANNGLMQFSLDWSIVKFHQVNGPYSTSSFVMDYANGVLALAPGGVTATWGKSYTAPNLSYFCNEQWHNILQIDNPELSGLYDLTAVAVNPRNPHEIYAGLFGGGVVKYDEHSVQYIYNRSNCPLYSFDSTEAYVGGLAFDAYGNLWVGTSYSVFPLSVLKTDGTWKTFPLSSYVSGYSTTIGDVMIDSRGFKWITVPRVNTVVVVDDKGTIDNTSDDRTTSVNMNIAANIETQWVNCVVEDKSGEIWFGCNPGIKVLYNPAQIFSGTVAPQNVLVKQINYVQNLFEFEEVTCIAVDDANRKWVGTAKSGVFLISENGDDQLLHFTTENSPLLSNKISNITIQRESGEVFFATANGLVSYRGTATAGAEDFSNVKVFPNPVRETYHGVITVSGLMENSFCKVADAAGNLVWQDYANGGTFTWDGKDFYGNRPATGVYFVFASDETGKKKNVARILFVH